MKRRRGGTRNLLLVLGRLQDLCGKARAAYSDDRSPDRAKRVCDPLDEAFNLCIRTLEHYPPMLPRKGEGEGGKHDTSA